MDAAVIGGGLFGITTALELDDAGLDVELFEQSSELMTAASRSNQGRLHRGYHYPRSKPTGRSCRDSASEFERRFPEAVVEDTDHYYCIASRKTKTSGEEFLRYCSELGLDYERAHPDLVDRSMVDVSVRVPENRIDSRSLRNRCKQDLRESDVRVHCDTRIANVDDLPHRYKIVATYAGLNSLLPDDSPLASRYKFELVEKPVVELPDEFEDTSVVVMDGPFMCFDPYGRTDDFLLGNVVEAIHETQVGTDPDFSERYDSLVDNGLIREPEPTKFDSFVESGTEFVPGLSNAEHVGSLYTIRTVLAGVEDTDERPTLVERDGTTFKVFSGKLASCIGAARTVRQGIENTARVS